MYPYIIHKLMSLAEIGCVLDSEDLDGCLDIVRFIGLPPVACTVG